MPRRALNVAPTDGSTKFNTIRIPLIPVACWRLEDPAFDFDSSFVSAKFRGEMVPTDPTQVNAEDDGLAYTSGQPASPLTTLSGIVSQNQGCPAAIFGHCDPAGTDALNKTLGDRRAIAIYALVTRQPDLWAYLYDNPQVGDKWDLRMVQAMLHKILDANGQPYLASDPTGTRDADTEDAVKRFQADAGLSADGAPGSTTRKALFGAYMDWLCTPTSPAAPSADTSTQPARFQMQPTDFLGGVGAQHGDLPKMSLQSCGKFNPILLLTTDEMGGEDTTDGVSKMQRNIDDAPNRRVIMYLFPQRTKVDSAHWPCPKVKEPNDACKSQFWPDGDARRKNGDAARYYDKTRDTMACRFYDRFARRSPCERQFCLRIWLQDRDRQRMPNAPYRLRVGDQIRIGNADEDGLVVEYVSGRPACCTIDYGEFPSDASDATLYRYARELRLFSESADELDRDFYNLAYWGHSIEASMTSFKNDYPDAGNATGVQNVHANGVPKSRQGQA
jgi:peptidoglycan hydrolase-like protein with peptidoglycan-binding domain